MNLIAALLVLAAAGGSEEEHIIRAWKKIQVTDKFYAEGAYIGDFNKGGKMDVVAGPYWIEGPDFTKTHAYIEEKAHDPNGYSKNFFAYSWDCNKDGWTDIIIYGFPGEDISWYENPQGKDGPWTRHKVIEKFDNESPQFVDVNGDGVPDVVGSIGGKLGYVTTSDWVFHPISPKSHYQRFTHGLGIGDMNGDGMKDIVSGKRYWAHGPKGDAEPNAPAVLYWFKLVRGKDGSVDWVPFKIDDDSGVGTQVTAADLNGDKYPDVIVGNKKGIVIHIGEAKKVSKEEYEKQLPKPVAGK